MKKKTIIILLILTVSIYALNINVLSAVEENDNRPTSLELTPHDPISITSDGDFNDYSFLGIGTEEDPYVIEGYNITTTSTNGIYITDTTKHFVVRNCYIDAKYYGIYITNVADGTATIINNTCNNNDYGIRLYFSGSSTINNNTCNNNDYGIWLSYSGSLMVANNTCNSNFAGIMLELSDSSTVANNTCDNNYYGISLSYSGISTVINNTCNNNYRGINLLSSGSSTIVNNTCSDNYREGILLEVSGSSTVANNTCSNNYWDGISLSYSGSSIVANNTFTNCGLNIYGYTLDAYLSYTVENNWVNGKKLGFYTNLDSTIIDEPVYGQLILVNCTNVTVRDQILNSATIGLFLHSCTSSDVVNNTCNNNNNGIYLLSSGSSTVANNTCSNNWQGILLYNSGSSTVANNTCSNNREGIVLWISGSSTVINNICNKNNCYGIYIRYSGFCVVTYNLLQENEEYGVYLGYGPDNNLIHHNTFVDNNLGGTSQACDDCTNNYWYDSETQEGNYWSDWSGEGSYSIDGDAGSVDPYPLDEPAEYSTDKNPLNFTFTLLMLVFPLILTRIISKKTKKK